MEHASQSPGGAAFLLALAQCYRDSGDDGASGEAMLKCLAHPDADRFSENERKDMAMSAMNMLKNSPGKLRQCLPLMEHLTPKYSILGMAQMLSEAPPKRGASAQQKKSQTFASSSTASSAPRLRHSTAAPKNQEWTGPLIEEISEESTSEPRLP